VGRRLVARIAVVSLGLVAGLAFGSQWLLGPQAQIDVLQQYLPTPTRCPNVCCSADFKRSMSPAQQLQVEGILRSRYAHVYADPDEIPESAWVLDCKADVCHETDLIDTCMIYWNALPRTPLSMTTTFRTWRGPEPCAGSKGTYVWAFYRWFEVGITPTVCS
jgi:hypothetical protein